MNVIGLLEITECFRTEDHSETTPLLYESSGHIVPLYNKVHSETFHTYNHILHEACTIATN